MNGPCLNRQPGFVCGLQVVASRIDGKHGIVEVVFLEESEEKRVSKNDNYGRSYVPILYGGTLSVAFPVMVHWCK